MTYTMIMQSWWEYHLVLSAPDDSVDTDFSHLTATTTPTNKTSTVPTVGRAAHERSGLVPFRSIGGKCCVKGGGVVRPSLPNELKESIVIARRKEVD